MSQENEIEAEKLNLTTDFLPSDGASCSAFWEAVASTARVIIETLPRVGSISLGAESRTLRDALTRIVGIMENNLLMGAERMCEARRSSPSAPGGDSPPDGKDDPR